MIKKNSTKQYFFIRYIL